MPRGLPQLLPAKAGNWRKVNGVPRRVRPLRPLGTARGLREALCSPRPPQPPWETRSPGCPGRPRAASGRPAGSGSPAPAHVAAGPLPADWSPLGAPHSPRAAPGSCTVTALRLPAFGMLTRFQGSGRRSTAAILPGGEGTAGGGAASGGGGAGPAKPSRRGAETNRGRRGRGLRRGEGGAGPSRNHGPNPELERTQVETWTVISVTWESLGESPGPELVRISEMGRGMCLWFELTHRGF